MIDNYWKNNLLVCTLGAFTTVFAMTLMLPFLPVYVEELGVVGHTKVVQWSGIAFSATFLQQVLLHHYGDIWEINMGVNLCSLGRV